MHKVLRHFRAIFLAFIAASFAVPAMAAVINVTAATGGGSISADTALTSWTALTGPALTETASSGISTGTIVLNAPAGFQFNTASAVTIAITGTGSGNDVQLASTTAAVTATTITITVSKVSTGSRLSTLTWSGIQVQPTAGTPLASGNITESGTSTVTLSSTNLGTLKEVVGAPSASKSTVVASPTAVPADGVSTSTITVTLTDKSGNPISGKTITLSAGGGSSVISGASGPSNASGVVTFTVRDSTTEGPIYYTAVDTTDGITITQNANVTFTAIVSSFNAFDSSTLPKPGAVTGYIQTKIAGSSFGLDIVAISAGAQASGFSGNVKVELVANTGAAIYDATTRCPASLTVIQTIPTFAISGGRSTISGLGTTDVYQDVRVRISYPAAAPTTFVCSNDSFAIRPNALLVNVTDNDWQTAGTGRTLYNATATGGNVHKAGQPFTLSVTGYNAAAAVTVNYNGSPAVQTIACTLPTPSCTNGSMTIGTWSASAGTVTATASYSEAGSFNLTMQDTAFAAVDAADGTPATCAGQYACSSAISVGRFVPDHFAVAPNNVPRLKTFNNSTCASRSFTYIGQPFGYATAPQALITAQNAANATTTNYTGNLWKLSVAAGTQDCTTNPDICTLTSGSATQQYTYSTSTGALPNWDNAQVVLGTPAMSAGTNGTGTLTGASGDLLAFKRNVNTPQALFTATITLTDSVTDNSENAVTGNGTINTLTPTAFSPVAFDAGNEFRYGRLKISNAFGSQLLALPVPMVAQYWDGTAFVTNTADNCTSIAAGSVALALSGISTTASLNTTFINGDSGLKLAAPNAQGYADITVTAPAYLQGAWTGTTYNQNPTARATFGVYKGNSKFIYMRENY